ncbi:MAG TPA: YceI family protein [Gemmatirosa sp.]|nr:YceI family protein [Gemmatirosa sp.]
MSLRPARLHPMVIAAAAATLALGVPGVAAVAQATATPVAAPAAPAARGARAHDVDRSHSEINFVASARLLDAHGHFKSWNADIQLDPEQLEQSRASIVIDTRVERRDNHLRSADFLNVAAHPTITFVSRSIARTSPEAGTITGDLTMRGVARLVTVPVSMVFYQNGRGRFRGQFTLKRSEYGITYSSTMNPIADEIEVQFNLSVVERKG